LIVHGIPNRSMSSPKRSAQKSFLERHLNHAILCQGFEHSLRFGRGREVQQQ
jgi:hypothetical protein